MMQVMKLDDRTAAMQKYLEPPASMCTQVVSGKVRKRLVKDGRSEDLWRSRAHTSSCCGGQRWLPWAEFCSRSSEDYKGSISLFRPITQHLMPMRTTEWRDQKISSRPIPRLFFETKIFETDTKTFFETKVFETNTETFFWDQIF